jgi:hypothetical protein
MTQMVKTTIVLPEDQLQQAKLKAVAEKKTLSSLIRQGLDLVLSASKKPKKADIDPMQTLGKLRLGSKDERYHRSEMYDDYLKRKVGY